MSKNNNLCNNCGKHGHLFHQCKLPITSYGIILSRSSEKGLQFLMIRRKDSFGYIDFIRGKYSPYNIDQVQNCINEMSLQEKERISREPFEKLWQMMWGTTSNSQYRNEEVVSSKKFETISSGVVINNNLINLQDLIKNSNSTWNETEWEFPKGRRNYQEKDLDCALREFEEETGYSQKDITIVENILPFEEIFIGSNHKSYKHKYYLNMMRYEDSLVMRDIQACEVSASEWKTYEECLVAIRPYNMEKRNILTAVNRTIRENALA
jgi:8-oxo-dGTP pyrophosphatase MutT (NUDIX family)